MKLRLRAVLIVYLLSLAILAASINPSAFAASTKLNTDPATVQKSYAPNEYFGWTINITDVSGLYGFEIKIEWNNSLITFQTVSYTANLNDMWGAGQWYKFINETGVSSGTGFYRLIAFGMSPAPSFTGNHQLFTVTFKVQDPLSNHNRTTLLHFATNKLSDIDSGPITNTPVDGLYTVLGSSTPAISMTPGNKICRKLNETFTTTISLANAYSVNGFGFEIHFNTTLLNYTSCAWGDLGDGGPLNANEATGVVTGKVGPATTPITGTHTLLTITWKASLNHIWKSEVAIPTWKNNQTGTIFFQKANLTYPSDSTLFYEKDVTYEFTVGSDFAYKWSPIKGDVYLNGNVGIDDLVGVCGYYDVKEGDGLWSNASKFELTYTGAPKIIDLYDLVIIASNFGFTYAP